MKEGGNQGLDMEGMMILSKSNVFQKIPKGVEVDPI